MRKFLLFIILVVAAGYWFKGFVRSGEFEACLDRHLPPPAAATVEYYWGVLLELADHTPSALYHLQRVQEKFVHTAYEPLAWAERIAIIDKQGDNAGVVAEGKRFLEAYPEHDKAELIRKKIAFIEHGY